MEEYQAGDQTTFTDKSQRSSRYSEFVQAQSSNKEHHIKILENRKLFCSICPDLD